MDIPMIWRLVGAFINVTILTRAGHFFLKRWIPDSFQRALVVTGAVAVIDFVGMWVMFNSARLGLHYTFFYYLPLLIMWLLKDMLEASRERRRA
ncbi:MAG: hypothetical protein AB7I96_05440 [Candidatus Dadabacteria bacterium]